MKEFIKKGLYFLPIPCIIILSNFFIDPAQLFDSKYEKGIANYLVQGYNVTDVLNYDERLLQRYFIEKMTTCPDTVILGASTIMLVNNQWSKNAINNGVSGASLEDDLAIYYLYEKKGCKLNKVIVGLDPYILNDNHGQVRWKTLKNEYEELSNKLLKNSYSFNIESFVEKYEKYKQLLSISYFNISLDYFFRGVKIDYKCTKNIINSGFTRLTNGSINYHASYRNASQSEVEKKVEDEVKSKVIYSLDNYTELSDHYKILFANFISYLQNKNIEVEFILPSYHPIMYAHLNKNKYFNIVFKAENYFINYAKTHKIKVYGSYNPRVYDLNNSSFYDSFHCKEFALKKIIPEPKISVAVLNHDNI